jgi:hypothetical protein
MQTGQIKEIMQPTKLNSRLSFHMLIETWRRKMAEGSEGLTEFYSDLLTRVSEVPELLQPIEDLEILNKHKKLVDLMIASVIPLTVSEDEDYYAIAVPFSYNTIFASKRFRKLFLKTEADRIQVEDDTAKNLSEEKVCSAYQLILNKFYNKKLSGTSTSVYPFKVPGSELTKYLQLEVDTSFVEVKAKHELPELPDLGRISCADDIRKFQTLREVMPLENFEFNGLVLIQIKDVTEQQIIHEIKNELIALDSFTDANTFQNLQTHIENLIASSSVKIGLTPFFKVNRHFVLSDQHDTGSMLFRNLSSFQEKNKVYQQIEQVFFENPEVLLIPEVTESTLREYSFLKPIYAEGGRSVIIFPLFNDKELLGTLEITSHQPGKLNQNYSNKILPAISLFVLALEKSAKNLANEIDHAIKEQFTAVQSSVEWRFTEAALRFISESRKNEDAKIEPIVFENVYPLYGAIDLRNSSTERNRAIQQDMEEQLKAVGMIIKKARQIAPFPLLDAINYKIEKYLNAVSNILLSDDEFAIHTFLKTEVASLFNHLQKTQPLIRKDIENYLLNVDPSLNAWNKHRKEFEQSITFLNNSIARFIDHEQSKAQKMFPHYFERFVTDGVDFNIYIGKSITPQRDFDNFYLKNLKIWQLSTLAKAARLSKQLESRTAKPLQTTQLILAHGQSISISFRTAERKFDVDGAYNIRYEIIKKRIDKVHIKDTNERLTQPGKLAIVYTQSSEAAEYLEYIEYLQSQQLLTGEVENFELEDLQGVSGLKAIRVSINLEDKAEEKKENRKLSARF